MGASTSRLRGTGALALVMLAGWDGRGAAVPSRPRDHNFWATAREDFEQRQALRRGSRAWKPGVPSAEGSLAYRGDAQAVVPRGNGDDGSGTWLSTSARLARQLGHNKETEAASNAWSAPHFGPSMLLSGEAALRHRPAPDPEEQDRLNALRQRQAYTGQTLAPDEFAQKVGELKSTFDKRHFRPGAEDTGAGAIHDRKELFEAILAAHLPHARDSCGARNGVGAHSALGKHGRDLWLAEDARQEAMAEQMWSQTSFPPAVAGSDAEAASEEGKEAPRHRGTPIYAAADSQVLPEGEENRREAEEIGSTREGVDTMGQSHDARGKGMP